MSETKPYISIIIPIYNSEPWLEKCLNSVVHQTYRNFEVILVNDGSTDKSGEICERFAASDTRIKVIHKTNGGVVSTRKAGLKKASGEFVGWVDSDDWIEDDYFEKMVKSQQQADADIVMSNHFRDIGSWSYTVCNKFPVGLYGKEELVPRLIYSGEFFASGITPFFWSKLFRKNILDKTQMNVDEKISFGDDIAVVYPSILEADKILVTDICGYHYVQHQGSITKSVDSGDAEKLRRAFSYLDHIFSQSMWYDQLHFQLVQWLKYAFLERSIWIFDEKSTDGSILCPFGKIPSHSRVVIYGGSAIGQSIKTYIDKQDLAQNVLWIDMTYENFRRQGLKIDPPKDIQKLGGEYDFVLLASGTKNIVDSMKEYMLELQVPEGKIRWLSEEFINMKDF